MESSIAAFLQSLSACELITAKFLPRATLNRLQERLIATLPAQCPHCDDYTVPAAAVNFGRVWPDIERFDSAAVRTGPIDLHNKALIIMLRIDICD